MAVHHGRVMWIQRQSTPRFAIAAIEAIFCITPIPALDNLRCTLALPNYRLYAIGHFVSVNGTWIQRVGLAWMTGELIGSGD